jgi:hypothetical protein
MDSDYPISARLKFLGSFQRELTVCILPQPTGGIAPYV